MKYFVPDIRQAADLPQQSRLEDKLGGLPWGLKADDWPKCRDCGKSQSLLAELTHDSERLDLGRVGRVLFVFQCNHDPGMCSTWERGSGANACFVMEPESLSDELSRLPNDSPLLENEARVVAWLERDDGFPAALYDSFFDEHKYAQLLQDRTNKIPSSTHLGGVPFFIQSPSEAPADGWVFVGQLDSTYSFLTPPKAQSPWIGKDSEQWEGRSHVGVGPNFGDGGIAYLFLNRELPVPLGQVFWQCG